jgi:plastocyanin
VHSVLAARTSDLLERRRGRVVLGRRLALATSLVAAAIVGVGALPGPRNAVAPSTPPLASSAVLIHAQDHSFTTPDIEVEAGTTVRWRNEGGTTHNLVRRLGGATVSEDLTPGQTESATFAEPGTYEYYCTIHPDMAGTVTVDA